MRTLATWSLRHRRVVVAGWLLVMLALTGASRAAGTSYSNSFTLPNTESTRATQLLQAAAPTQAGATADIVIGTQGHTTVADPAVRPRIQAMLARVARLPHITSLASPYSLRGRAQVNKDATVAFAVVTYDRQAQALTSSDAKALVKTATQPAAPDLQVAVAGQVAQRADPPSLGGVGFGILAAAVVLLVVFGSLLAMALPLASALVSLGSAIGLIGLASHLLTLPEFSTQLVLLIGLGVGVDYALFIVSRHRRNLLEGRDVASSIKLRASSLRKPPRSASDSASSSARSAVSATAPRTARPSCLKAPLAAPTSGRTGSARASV